MLERNRNTDLKYSTTVSSVFEPGEEYQTLPLESEAGHQDGPEERQHNAEHCTSDHLSE